jgi:hypothetical protein
MTAMMPMRIPSLATGQSPRCRQTHDDPDDDVRVGAMVLERTWSVDRTNLPDPLPGGPDRARGEGKAV